MPYADDQAPSAPQTTRDRAISAGATISPRLTMSRDTAISGAGPSTRVINRSVRSPTGLTDRSGARGRVPLGSRRPPLGDGTLPLGFEGVHLLVVAVLVLGEQPHRAEHRADDHEQRQHAEPSVEREPATDEEGHDHRDLDGHAEGVVGCDKS